MIANPNANNEQIEDRTEPQGTYVEVAAELTRVVGYQYLYVALLRLTVSVINNPENVISGLLSSSLEMPSQ